MSETVNTAAVRGPAASLTAAKEWQQKEFLPWKQAVEKHAAERLALAKKLAPHVPQLQALTVMMMQGRTRQAVLTWNALGMVPQLEDIHLAKGGEAVSFVLRGGEMRVARMEDVLAELAELVKAADATYTTTETPAGAGA